MPHGKPVLVEGSAALEELRCNWATMDLEAFARKWGITVRTVRQIACRKGISSAKNRRPGKRRQRFDERDRARCALNTMPVPWPFCTYQDAPYNQVSKKDRLPIEGYIVSRDKNH